MRVNYSIVYYYFRKWQNYDSEANSEKYCVYEKAAKPDKKILTLYIEIHCRQGPGK